MAVKMNISILTKKHAADLELGFLKKSISKTYGCATAMPIALELIILRFAVFRTLFSGTEVLSSIYAN